ncbi:MAG: SPOR domain-containing protein [Vitreoscilla sp.]|nr:SPOR domain-containing protein [Vitreoscilla sp.]
MGLLSKFKSSATEPRAGASTDAHEVVRDARTRARRRLIGAALLLGIGIIGFPLLFENQPRPIPVDIPIEIPSRESVAPLVSPASRPAARPAAPVAKPPVEQPQADAPVAAPASEPAKATPERPASAPAKPASVAATPAPAAQPAEPKASESKPAPKAAEAKPADTKPPTDAAKDDGRYVVQIGAFAEVTGAREARMKVEAMGLKTYTQVIESASGRRIRVRVGPYATKAEAEKAAARIKSGGLQAAVLVL